MKIKTPIVLLAAAGLVLPVIGQTQSNTIPRQLAENFRVAHFVEPIFPSALRNKSVIEGYVQIQILVGADGSVLELFTSAYSRIEFAESAERALANWKFRPTDDPAALPQRFNMRIDFRREGMLIVQGDFQETVDAFLHHSAPETDLTVCKLRDLDATPEIVNLVVPEYPAALKKQKIEGSATVSFFIDEEGHVHVASVAGSTRPEFAVAALAAVKQWTFTPPQRKGAATRVFAVQDFNFSPETGTPQIKSNR